MPTNAIAAHYRYTKCNMFVDSWIVNGQGPMGPVQVLPADDKRLFLGITMQAGHLPYDDLLILGGELAGGARMAIASSGVGPESIQNFSFKYADHGGVMQGPLTAMYVSFAGHQFTAVSSGCLCPIREYVEQEYEYPCMNVYDVRTAVATIGAGVALAQLFPSNPNRLSLIISVQGAMPGSITISQGIQLSGWYQRDPPWNESFSYRDYGPLIQREIWCSTGNANVITVSATEVFKIEH